MSKILIVEDDSLILRLYEKAFSFEKYEVATAADGAEALTKVKSFKPDLILLDIMMPKVNGLEVLKKLKADSATKKIPVVILTNLSDKKDAEKALSLGAKKYIVKADYKPKEVVDIVKGFL